MDKVIVTGFGPFGDIKINSSWEVAKELSSLGLLGNAIKIEIENIPVIYAKVTERIPELWKLHSPVLMVHIGVSAYANEITLETCAHRDGYSKPDITGNLPERPNSTDSDACTWSCFDVEKVAQEFNATTESRVKCCVSSDAGRFLCEFIYYSSLCLNQQRTIFIHVPHIDKPYTVKEMAKAVQEIILLLLNQIRTQCPNHV